MKTIIPLFLLLSTTASAQKLPQKFMSDNYESNDLSCWFANENDSTSIYFALKWDTDIEKGTWISKDDTLKYLISILSDSSFSFVIPYTMINAWEEVVLQHPTYTGLLKHGGYEDFFRVIEFKCNTKPDGSALDEHCVSQPELYGVEGSNTWPERIPAGYKTLTGTIVDSAYIEGDMELDIVLSVILEDKTKLTISYFVTEEDLDEAFYDNKFFYRGKSITFAYKPEERKGNIIRVRKYNIK